MNPTQRFTNQVVLVTGASRGIGRAAALAFAAEGAAVAVLATSPDGVKRVADEIASAGGRALPLVGDVTSEEDVRRCVSQAEHALGPLNVLVSSAGVTGPTVPATEMPLEAWNRVLAVNLTGVFLCAREVLRAALVRAKASGAAPSLRSIVNIGSIAGKISYPYRTPYASSKWGLIGLTLTLAEEAGRHGIRVNCVCPGPVEGQMLESVMAARAQAMGLPLEHVRKQFLGLTMLKRLVKNEDIAALVLFLASDAAANITGQAIDVTGGWAQMRE
jgi:NAD(P)-dependent dehydrogenase (short-subunit alcohol dehydrogenase family)